MSRLALYLLGQARIEVNGAPVEIARRKAVALLAYLAVTRRSHNRDALATLFWPEYDQARARAALRRTLSVLNKDFGDWLEIGRETAGIRPNADLWLDADFFVSLAADCQAETAGGDNCTACLDSLAQAIALYQDDFLAGFTLPDAPDFDEWQFFHREELRRTLATVLERLVDCHTAQGTLDPAITYARRWLKLEPLHEPVYRRLMSLYALAGQRPAALRQYDECVRILEQELGLAPSAETVDLYEQIRTGRLGSNGETPAAVQIASGRRSQVEASPAAPASPASSSLPAEAPAEGTVFVARERELEQMQAFFYRALAGQGQLIFVTGEAGSGKTALVLEFARQAQAAVPDLIIAIGNCNAQTGLGDPYLPFREILDLLAGDLETHWVRDTITRENVSRLRPFLPAVWQALANLGPDLVNSFVPGPVLAGRAAALGSGWLEPAGWQQLIERRGGEGTNGLDQRALFEQFTQVLQALARQKPLLLVLDDFHWADLASISLLFHLGRRLAGSRILLALIYRSDEVALGRGGERHPLAPVINELKRTYGNVELDLDQKTDRHFIDALLETESNELGPEFRAALFRHTQGHPLFTVELLRTMQERGDLVRDDQGRWVEGAVLDWQQLPARVEAVVEERVRRLEPELRDLLAIASVEGESFTAQTLARVQGLPERRVLRLLSQELEKRHLLVREEGEVALGERPLSRYQFTHVLFQQYLYHDLSAGERRLLHGDVAAALEELYSQQLQEIAVPLARHYTEAGQGDRAVDYLLAAGDKARDLYAHQEAIDFYQQALIFLKEQGPAGREQAARTLMRLGLTYHFALDFRRAHQSYEEGFSLWQLTGSQQPARLPVPPHPLRLAETQPASIDPGAACDGGSISIIDQLFSGLMAIRPEMDVVPEITRRWEMLSGGREYIFHLRDDVSWSDGAPVTAGDFVYAWQRTLQPALQSQVAGLLYDVKGARAFNQGEISDPAYLGVRALDPFTLYVELEGPTGYFPQLVANSATYPLPRHVVERYGNAWTEPEHFVTNGSFKVKAWQPGTFMRLERNPAYRGQFTGNVEEVELRLSLDAQTQLEQYEDSTLDVLDLWNLSPTERDRARQWHAGEYVFGPGLDTTYVGFDASRPPFDDVRVRRALVMATDREMLANVILGGFASPALGGFVPPGMPGHLPDIGLPYRPEQARRLLAEAGYPEGRGFPPLEWLVKPSNLPKAEFLQAQWRQNLGLDLKWQIVEREILHDRVHRTPPHIFLMGWIADYLDADSFLRVGLYPNQFGWHNETYTALVERARQLGDPQERLELYRQADHLLIREAAILPMAYMRRQLLVKPWIRQFPTSVIKRWFWKDVIIEPH